MNHCYSALPSENSEGEPFPVFPDHLRLFCGVLSLFVNKALGLIPALPERNCLGFGFPACVLCRQRLPGLLPLGHSKTEPSCNPRPQHLALN